MPASPRHHDAGAATIHRPSQSFTQSRQIAGFRRTPPAILRYVAINTIARNLRVNRYRREGGEHRGFDQEIDFDNDAFADPEPSPEQRLAARQREGRIRAALRQLSPHQIHLLQLSFFADSTHDDISRDLRLPLGTVKSQIRRALISMRRHLEATES